MTKHLLKLTTVSAMALLLAVPSMAQTSQDNASDNPEASEEADGGSANALDNIVVTGTRQERKVLDIPANISVLSDEELQRRLDFTLEDTLRYEAGIAVTRQTSGTDPFSNSGGVQIRGVGGNRTQVIVDGTRTIESIEGGSRDVVDSSNMKAVEIQRGPASVLWGSDGLGGVVAFITKDPEDYLKDDATFGGNASVNYSTVNNSLRLSAAGATQISPNVSGLLIYTRTDSSEMEVSKALLGAGAVQNCTRSPEAIQCDEFDPMSVDSNNILGKLVWNPSDNNQFRLSGEYSNSKTDMDQDSILGPQFSAFTGALQANVLSYNRIQEITRWRLSLDQEWSPEGMFFDNLRWKATISPQDNNRNGDRRRTLQPSGDQEQFLDDQEYGETFKELDIQLSSSLQTGSITHNLTYGFDGDITETDYNRVDITRNLTTMTETVRRAGGFNFADAKTTRADVYIQNEMSLLDDRLDIVLGARQAHYKIDPTTDADYQLVPGAEPRVISESDFQAKAGMIFKLNDTFSVYGQYGQGFKMPTAQQLYQSLDSLPFFALIPNPNLTPESVQNYEIGIRGSFGSRGFFSANVFKADYVDFIENFVTIDPVQFGLPAGTPAFGFDNVDGLEMRGFEASAGWQLSERVSTRMSASWQEGTIIDGTTERLYRGALPLKVVAGVRWNDPDLGLDFDLSATFQDGDAEVIDPATEFSPAGYAVFDFVASWEFMPNMKLQANIFNLTDKRYFGADTRGFAINGSDNAKRLNPIELRTAPGRNFKFGLAWEF